MSALVVAALALLVANPPPGVAATAAASERPGAERGAATAALRTCPSSTTRTRRGRSVIVSIACRGLNAKRARRLERPSHGRLGPIRQRSDRVRYFPRPGFIGLDAFVIGRPGQRRATTYLVRVGPRRDSAPRCRDKRVSTNYGDPVEIEVTCRGRGLDPLEVIHRPAFGDLDVTDERGDSRRRTITLKHSPQALFSGGDGLIVEGSGRGGSDLAAVAIEVEPWRMRALGDSVTAGFGYFDDGSLMPLDDLPDCKPTATTLNDRCSSNSDRGPEFDSADPAWAPDYGLANDVAWPAQFANDLQGGGRVTAPDMFQNLAVTGSAPSDWLSGSLASELDRIVTENPDLIVTTMGANPLLDDLLLTGKGEECAFTESVATLEACVLPFFENADLEANLESYYRELLKAPAADVVVMQYHLAVPSLNLFDTWQLEAMIGLFNEQIATAVGDVQSSVADAKAERLHMVVSQVDPTNPQPDQIARFNIGLPPQSEDTWQAPYDCGDSDFVDGPSHQSDPTQTYFEVEHPEEYCEGEEWIISADSGIHPSAAGYAQFAAALGAYATENDLVPPLP